MSKSRIWRLRLQGKDWSQWILMSLFSKRFLKGTLSIVILSRMISGWLHRSIFSLLKRISWVTSPSKSLCRHRWTTFWSWCRSWSIWSGISIVQRMSKWEKTSICCRVLSWRYLILFRSWFGKGNKWNCWMSNLRISRGREGSLWGLGHLSQSFSKVWESRWKTRWRKQKIRLWWRKLFLQLRRSRITLRCVKDIFKTFLDTKLRIWKSLLMMCTKSM